MRTSIGGGVDLSVIVARHEHLETCGDDALELSGCDFARGNEGDPGLLLHHDGGPAGRGARDTPLAAHGGSPRAGRELGAGEAGHGDEGGHCVRGAALQVGCGGYSRWQPP